jgi:hypothetical protein
MNVPKRLAAYRTGLVLAVLLALASSRALAQEYPRYEIFGGGSVICAFCSFSVPAGVGFGGWQASVDGNFNRWFGVVGDFGGQTRHPRGESAWLYEYLTGPQFSKRGERFTLFGHGLVGGAHVGGFPPQGSFAAGFGGGADVTLSRRIALRAAQVDYIRQHYFGGGFNDYRLGIGVVVRLGGK